MDAISPGDRHAPEALTIYSVITSSPKLVVPSGRTIQGCGTVHLLGVVGLLPRWPLARIRPPSLHSLSYRFQEENAVGEHAP
jgi:hypothetical protein